MPLTPAERRFLRIVDRLKVYVLALAVAVFFLVLLTPQTKLTLPAATVICATAGLLWVVERLLSLLTVLDVELKRVTDALKQALPHGPR